MTPHIASKLECWIRGIDKTTEVLGKSVAWLTLLMMFISVIVVVLRYLFNIGNIALQESVMYLHAFLFMSAVAFTLKHDGHVRVDIFYRRMSKRAQAWVDLCGGLLLLLPVTLFIGISSWDYVINSWMLQESSPEAGGLPLVYLLKGMIFMLVFTLALQGIAEILRNLMAILGWASAPEHHVNEEML